MSAKKSGFPSFNEFGLLPVGTHAATIETLKKSVLVVGLPDSGAGISIVRLCLVNYLKHLADDLWRADIYEIYVGGPFVTDVAEPDEMPVVFVCDLHEFASESIQANLNARYPEPIWTWDEKSSNKAARPGGKALKSPLWNRYRAELYPIFVGSNGKELDPLNLRRWLTLDLPSGREKGIVRLLPSRKKGM
jgi:hypothetical protein